MVTIPLKMMKFGTLMPDLENLKDNFIFQVVNKY